MTINFKQFTSKTFEANRLFICCLRGEIFPSADLLICCLVTENYADRSFHELTTGRESPPPTPTPQPEEIRHHLTSCIRLSPRHGATEVTGACRCLPSHWVAAYHLWVKGSAACVLTGADCREACKRCCINQLLILIRA